MMLAFVIAEAIIGIIAVLLAAYYAAELDRLQAKHARHGAPAQVTARHDVTREPRTVLVAVPAAAGQEVTLEEWQSYLKAGRAVEPVRTGEHPPWTGSQPVLDEEAEAAERDRQQYIRSHLAGAEGMTDDDIRRAMHDAVTSPRALPAPAPLHPHCRHCDPACTTPHHVACIGCQPVHGEAPVASVLAAQDGTQMAEVYLP